MLLLGISVALILYLVYCSPFELMSASLRAALAAYESPGHAVIAGVLDALEEKEDSLLLVLRNASLVREGKYLALGRVRVSPAEREACRALKIGWTLRAEGELARIAAPENPGEFDQAAYWRLKGTHFRMRKAGITVLEQRTEVIKEGLARLKAKARARIAALFPGDVAPIVTGMLLGDRSDIDADTRALWQAGGLAHMLAISGLHLGLIGMGLFRLLRAAGLPLLPSSATAFAALLLYACLIGFPVSAVRALMMFALMLGGKLSGRTYDALTALAFSAVSILVVSPAYLMSPAFQMSCCAVLIMSAFSKRSKAALALLLALWMLPLEAASCFELPLLAVPLNLLAVPLLPLILVGGFAATAGSFAAERLPFLAAHCRLAASMTALPVRTVNALLARASSLPFSVLVSGKPAAWQTGLYLLLIAVWTWWHARWRLRPRRFLLLLMLPLPILVLSFRPRSELKITFLSVGQGDGIVIEAPSGHTVLVDGGSSSVHEVGRYRLAPFFKYEGVSRLDYVLATHADEDHISGIRELLAMAAGGGRPRIGTLLLPDTGEMSAPAPELEEMAARAGARVRHLTSGDSLRIGRMALSVLGPDGGPGGLPFDANSECIVFALHYGRFDAVFTGDVEGAGEEALIKKLEGMAPSEREAELLKVAHHGSKGSTPEALLRLIQPQVSVISAGRGNRYGHPHEELLRRLEACGSRIFRTDRDGAVTVETDGQRYRVSTFL